MVNKITTIGNLVIDDIILYDERKMYLELMGGAALFAAIGAHIWGELPTIQARIGKSFPETSLERLRNYGINFDLVNVSQNDLRSWMLYEPGGARQFINHLSSGSNYELSITGSELNPNNLISGGIHVAPMPTDIQHSVLKTIHKKRGSETIVSWDPHIDFLEQEKFKQLALEMLTYVDIFLPSKEEVGKLMGHGNLLKAARDFAELGPEIVVIKKSIEGSLVYIKKTDKFIELPIFPTKTVDPTGAGDAFCGGFLSCFLKSKDPVLSAAHGTVSSSFSVEQVGALAILESSFADKNKRLGFISKNIKEL